MVFVIYGGLYILGALSAFGFWYVMTYSRYHERPCLTILNIVIMLIAGVAFFITIPLFLFALFMEGIAWIENNYGNPISEFFNKEVICFRKKDAKE